MTMAKTNVRARMRTRRTAGMVISVKEVVGKWVHMSCDGLEMQSAAKADQRSSRKCRIQPRNQNLVIRSVEKGRNV